MLRGLILSILIKDGGLNEIDLIRAVAVPQPVAIVASRLGVLGWFGSTWSINTGTGSIGEPPNVDECSTQHEEITVDCSQPECSVPDRKEALLKRE